MRLSGTGKLAVSSNSVVDFRSRFLPSTTPPGPIRAGHAPTALRHRTYLGETPLSMVRADNSLASNGSIPPHTGRPLQARSELVVWAQCGVRVCAPET